jgi:hypothetical protein
MRRGVPITRDEEAAIKAALETTPHALAVARDSGGAWSYSTVWRVAEREYIQLTAEREPKHYKRLAPERRDKVVEARRVNPAGTQEEIARAAGVSRSTVSRIERGDRRAVALLNFG